MAFLTRTDPARNIDRFYVVDITPTGYRNGKRYEKRGAKWVGARSVEKP
jgi:hypothetical protein